MLARFSTVAGEQGSPDTWRDPRGFALKFYTTEGNYDLVGNNTPVFFVRDTMKFPHFIRSQKRRGGNGLRDNNMQWDFWSLNPESAHQVTYLMGDRGIPKTYRHMNGYGSHTYLWVNEAGEKHWVKYHFHSDQGVEGLTDDEATRIAGEDADFHRRDLYDSIAQGDFPSWTLSIQAMPYEDAKTYRINPFDLTKIWPHSDYPLIKVGTMTLNRNPENFFARDRAGRLRAQRARAGHRLQPRQDAARPGVRLRRHAPPPDRARTTCSSRSTGPHVEVNTYTQDGADGLRAPRRRPGLRAELLRPRVRRQGRRGRRRLGDRRRDGASGLHAARGRRRLLPGRHAGARGLGRRAARGVRARPSPGTCSAGSRATCSSGPSSTGRASTPTPARGSRSSSAQDADLGAPGAQPDDAAAAASDPIVEAATNADT